MKIFKKTHFWKDNRTFIEVDLEEPKIERDYPQDGSFLLKIGDQSGIKSAFKLNPDEARALKDALKIFLESYDKKMSELMSNDYSSNNYSQYQNNYSQPPSYQKEPEKPSFDDTDYNSYPKKEEYSYKPDYAEEPSPRYEYTKMPDQKPKDSFFIFGNDEPKKEEPKKPNVEFYF